MQWTDDGIILGTRRHGETSVILELMTPAHGRHLGLVRGGRSRRQQPFLQPGNSLSATWRARLDEHLGNYSVEPTAERASRLMAGPCGIYALQVLSGLLRLLPERDPHPRLYRALEAILDHVGDDPVPAGELVARFELETLGELGVGLDLAACAVTGARTGLAFVSPRSGRAVSADAAGPYRDRLLPLPRFLTDRAEAAPDAADILDAFRLSGFFLERHVYEPRGLAAGQARDGFLELLRRSRRLPLAAAG